MRGLPARRRQPKLMRSSLGCIQARSRGVSTPFEDFFLVDSRAASRRPLPSCRSPHHRLRHDPNANVRPGCCWWPPRRICRLTLRFRIRASRQTFRTAHPRHQQAFPPALTRRPRRLHHLAVAARASVSTAHSTSRWPPLGGGCRVLPRTLSVDIGRRHLSRRVSPAGACATCMTPWSSTQPIHSRPRSHGTDRHDASLRQRRLLAERPYAPLVPCGPWDFPSARLSTRSAVPQALTALAPASRQGRLTPRVPSPSLRRATDDRVDLRPRPLSRPWRVVSASRHRSLDIDSFLLRWLSARARRTLPEGCALRLIASGPCVSERLPDPKIQLTAAARLQGLSPSTSP